MLATQKMYQQILTTSGDLDEVEVIETKDGISTDTKAKATLGTWLYAEIYVNLLAWMKILANEFNLFCDLFDTLPALEIAKLPKNAYACFIPGYTSRGELRSTIRLNSMYVDSMPFWELLASLTHELVHCHIWNEAVEENNNEKKSCKHNKNFRAMLMQIGIEVNGKGQHIRYGKVAYMHPTKEEKKDGKKEGWAFSENGRNRFFEVLKANGIDCPETYVSNPVKETKKQRIDWKDKVAELQKQVTNLEQKLKDAVEQTSEQNPMVTISEEVECEQDLVMFAGKKIAKIELAPICEFVLAKIANEHAAKKDDMIIAVNAQFPRSETAKKFGIDPTKTGKDTFFMLALHLLEKEKKVMRKRIEGKKVAYFLTEGVPQWKS